MRSKFLKLYTLIVIFSTLNCFGGDFQTISKSLLTLQGKSGKYALAAVVDFGDGQLYAVTSQSVFLSGILSCKLRDFAGNSIRGIRVEVAANRDLIRVPITKNDFIKPLKVIKDANTLYQMNSLTGVVMSKKYNDKSLNIPGSLLLSSDGISCVISAIKGYAKLGQLTASLVKIDTNVKWQKVNFTKFITQCRSLSEMCSKILSLEKIEAANKMNQFMDFSPEFSEAHIKWVKDHNQQYEDYLLNPHTKGKSMGAAKAHHEARCTYYAGLRGLSSFAFNITKNVEITKWYSKFLKQTAAMVAKRSKKLNDRVKSHMKQMVKQYPSTKAKF